MVGKGNFRLAGHGVDSFETVGIRLGDQRVCGGEDHREQAGFVVVVPGGEVQEFCLGDIGRFEGAVRLVESAVNLIEVIAPVEPRAVIAGVDGGHQFFSGFIGEQLEQFLLVFNRTLVDFGHAEGVDHVGLCEIGAEFLGVRLLVADAEVADEEDVVPGLFDPGADCGELFRRPGEERVEIDHRLAVPVRIVGVVAEEVEHPLELLHLLVDAGFHVETDADLEISAFGRLEHGVHGVDEGGGAAALVRHQVREEAVDPLCFGVGELLLPVFDVVPGRVLEREVVVVDCGQAGVERGVPRRVVCPAHFPVRDFPALSGGECEEQSSRTECVFDSHMMSFFDWIMGGGDLIGSEPEELPEFGCFGGQHSRIA